MVAASTASRNAARTPWAFEHREPGGGRAPGRRDRGAQRLGGGVAVAEQRRGAEEGLAHERARWCRGGARRARRPRSSPRRRRNTYAGPEPDSPVTASSWASGTRTTTPTAPRMRSHTSRSSCGRVLARRRSRRRPGPTSAPVLGIARTTGRPGRAASSAAMVTPGRDRQHQRALGEHVGAARERVDGVARLHREHEHVGVGRGPRRAGHDAHAGEPRLERVAALGVDLGDRERVRVPAGVEQADRERLAHATAAEECHAHLQQGNRGRTAVRTRDRTGRARRRTGRARGTFGPTPHFPERDGPPAPRARTQRTPSGPACTETCGTRHVPQRPVSGRVAARRP